MKTQQDIKDIMFFHIWPAKTRRTGDKGFYIVSDPNKANKSYKLKTPQELKRLVDNYSQSKKNRLNDIVHPELIYITYDAPFEDGPGCQTDIANWMNLVEDGKYEVLKSFVKDRARQEEFRAAGGVSEIAFAALTNIIERGNEACVTKEGQRVINELLERGFTP